MTKDADVDHSALRDVIEAHQAGLAAYVTSAGYTPYPPGSGFYKPRRAPLKRGKPPKRKGGSRFPKQRDKAYCRWLAGQARDACCDASAFCRSWSARLHRAHLNPKGRGGPDLNNIVLLCNTCHLWQEKRTDAFIRETGVDLYAIAKAHTQRYLASHA